MTAYFTAPDGHGEPALWVAQGDLAPAALIRRCDLGPMTHHWDELVARAIAGNPAIVPPELQPCPVCRIGGWNYCRDETGNTVEPDGHNGRHRRMRVLAGLCIERGGHTWTIIGGNPTAHCQCGATMNVPVVAESIAESVRRAGEVAMAAHYKTLPPTPELCAGMGCIQDVGHDGPCLDWGHTP